MLTCAVEDNIRSLLLQKFALIFGRWSASDTHYLAIYATYAAEDMQGYDSVLLEF